MTLLQLTFIILGGILGIFIIFLILKARKLPIKAPKNNPSWFLEKLEQKYWDSQKKRIVFLGDSITHALVSADYVKMVKQKVEHEWPNTFHFINAGINDELVWHVLQRLDEVIACEPDIVIILIGTNDCHDTKSEAKKRLTKALKGLPELPSKKLFIKHYSTMIDRLKKETDAKIAVLSLPPIGEDPNLSIFRRTIDYSNEIKKIAERENLSYLPLNENIRKVLQDTPTHPHISLKNQQIKILRAIYQHLLFNKSFDKIAQDNGFQLLTDGIHLNSKGAEMIKDLIVDYLKKEIIE